MALIENIFTALKEKRMTQKEFSKLSGIPESTISDWKRKGKTPGIDNLLMISRTLGVSLYELLSDGSEDSNDKVGAALFEYFLDDSERLLIDQYRSMASEQKKRVTTYFEKISETSIAASVAVDAATEFTTDTFFKY